MPGVLQRVERRNYAQFEGRNLRAKIVFQTDNRNEAEAIAAALDPDNRQMTQGMRISTRSSGSRVITEIKFSGRMQTLMATIDDLLKCAQAAERALKPVSDG